jgi:nitroreductase
MMETIILDLLRKRKATRAFSDRSVEPDKLDVILEAARLSASCNNNQPWRFLVLTEREALEKGRAALSGGNYWAKRSPVLIFGFSKPDLDCVIAGVRQYYQFDLGLSVQNILLQATELDLVARPMAGFRPSIVRSSFDIPDEYRVMVAIAIGYEGDVSTLSEKHQAISLASRERKSLSELVHFNTFKVG